MHSIFVGVQVAVDGEGWMVRVCLVILNLSRRDSLQTSAFKGSLPLHLSISHFARESFIKLSLKYNVCATHLINFSVFWFSLLISVI